MTPHEQQVEKELNEAKAAIQLMEHGKYGRVHLSEQIRELTSRLEASELQKLRDDECIERITKHGLELELKLQTSECANSEMRIARLQHGQNIAQLRTALKKAHDAMVTWFSSEYCEHPVSKEVGEALSSTSGQSYIPREHFTKGGGTEMKTGDDTCLPPFKHPLTSSERQVPSRGDIPREVGEKMYEALGFAKVAFNKADISLPFTEHKMDNALQLAQSYGLGKDKLNENS